MEKGGEGRKGGGREGEGGGRWRGRSTWHIRIPFFCDRSKPKHSPSLQSLFKKDKDKDKKDKKDKKEKEKDKDKKKSKLKDKDKKSKKQEESGAISFIDFRFCYIAETISQSYDHLMTW